ncbi:hypothetical protein GENT11_19140 [Flavobacterium ammonificans]|uniref:Uncharacterized protein n=2 Tax=Flavobacterium ammonificans TaxID=1751056 RepID=A0ABM7V0L8_9FLAO|nr:hypothetical protein GENT11_19140 [Flavobacterium ammonificans]
MLLGLILLNINLRSQYRMNNNYVITEKSLQDFYNRISSRIRSGFIVKEKNDKLPFAILTREPKIVNHSFNLVLCCLTFGLWSIIWIYQTLSYGREKRILISIDEDGKTFEETCY